ncbi:hypothetical protein AQUCO_01300566v1 [Aquilegia coerulea]|uniref:Uncharacterized protein n=1 Tax=Aquilegia coerulea TaxID=218851 RepID=A0A2G5E2F3_AQUCA|nr:hypothetical protein AQUCO_01300566v1 [Aquilegia coerulea]
MRRAHVGITGRNLYHCVVTNFYYLSIFDRMIHCLQPFSHIILSVCVNESICCSVVHREITLTVLDCLKTLFL